MNVLRSNKGFSLIELMIVVVIIGILSSIAVPNFQKFQAKAKQTEAKTNLAAVYTAQKAFHAEWNMYYGDFRDIGFSPEGKLRYHIDNGGGGPVLPPSYTYVGGAGTGNSGAINDTGAYCPQGGGGVTTACEEVNTYVRPGASAAVNPTQLAFTASASGDLDGDAGSDVWTINQDKTMANPGNDI